MTEADDHQEEQKVPFTAHLEELRNRLVRSFIAIVIGASVAYAFKEKLFDILTRPLLAVMPADGKIIFTGLPEAFFTYLKVSLLAGVFLAAPVVLFEFWMFVVPGLYKKERRLLAPVIFLSTLFFVGGSLFGYFFVFPVGFKFFLGFSSDTLQALPSMKEYLGFVSKLLIAFGVVFEMPIIITCMAALGLVSTAFLRKNRKYAVVIFFIVGAILTPPDVVTQILMALPLIVLYEFSIIGAMIFGRKPMEETEEDDDETDPVPEGAIVKK
ncbi:MAG: twin-arginine translocase subunit TatC [Proteobacteria bacterium]|nr:twin-arginine translocase subunit TatC [Pseudomonadota bacterium]